ncbi:hypothetical protein [Oleiharenicola sp. Vm1]
MSFAFIPANRSSGVVARPPPPKLPERAPLSRKRVLLLAALAVSGE